MEYGRVSENTNTHGFEQLIQQLHEKNKLTKQVIHKGTTLYRVQPAGYPTANPFSTPVVLGRYNDPLNEMKVWYGAQHPTGALAETFGRLRPGGSGALGVVLSTDDLNSRDMCEVETCQSLTVLDLKSSLSRLGLTVDSISNPDYTLTNNIVRIVSRLPGRPFNGIAYESRHHPDGLQCYALWIDAQENPTVSGGRIRNLSQYIYSGELPNDWDEEDIDTEEMLTEILGYRVIHG